MTTNANKYLKIFEALAKQIWSGKYVANQQLPSENELAKTYHVSRITSKRALQELANIGLVERRQGSGTFIRSGFKRHQRTNQVLLVIPFDEAGLGDYLTGIKSVLRQQQQELTVIENRSFSLDQMSKITTQYDGVIFYPQDLANELTKINSILFEHFPFVLIDQTAPGLPVPSVVADNVQGGYLATNTLVQMGHRQIAFLSQTGLTRALNSSVAQRYFGYLQALAEHDLTGATTPQTAYTLTENNFTALLPYIKQQQLSAIVCENDTLAIRLLKYFKQNNFPIPNQISIIGFDNISKAATSKPQLSTIAQNFTDIGRQAAQLLQQRITNPYEPKIEKATVPVELVSRQSVNVQSSPLN
ncbi:GntR family transcriptional regulator [Lapidilactobacillus bayanensis]|uniref:GntR family transcriptional regulator n=1 Tax=Lapidilactobacillus bayanensis TaxID=2485998 RepID=UPI000F79DA04|nr:LacI family DNA-binding transcriptional regulator [Lapidilactobacillus bayanensis]